MNKRDCFYLGEILKPQGLHGALTLKIEIDFFEYLIDNLESVFVEINEQLVPFFIYEIDHIADFTAILFFDEVEDETAARKFSGLKVYVENKLLPEEANNADDYNLLKGYSLIDSNSGFIGAIENIFHYSSNTVFQVFVNDREVLVPAVNELIQEINSDKKEIIVNCPEGLLEIYL